MITIQADRLRKLVRMRLSGFLTLEEVADFALAHETLITDMGWSSGNYFLLVDAADSVTYSPGVVSAFQEYIRNSKYKAARIAIVRPSALTRIQARRIVGERDSAAVFDSVEEAERSLV